MAKADQIRATVRKAFAKLRAMFFPDNPTVNLIKISEAANEYTPVLTLTDWFFEYSDFRQNYLLQIADDSSELTTAMAAATHVSVGSDIYVIARSDTKAPQGTDILWSLSCTKYFNANQLRAL